jgi:hypothetical protein
MDDLVEIGPFEKVVAQAVVTVFRGGVGAFPVRQPDHLELRGVRLSHVPDHQGIHSGFPSREDT